MHFPIRPLVEDLDPEPVLGGVRGSGDSVEDVERRALDQEANLDHLVFGHGFTGSVCQTSSDPQEAARKRAAECVDDLLSRVCRLMASERNQFIASRFVKEIARLGGNVKPFVSPLIAADLYKRLKDRDGRSKVNPEVRD